MVFAMKLSKALNGVALVSVLAMSGMAVAGPQVSVTFKNNGSEDAFYSAVGSNGVMTRNNASPAPAATVGGGQSSFYRVQSTISPDANYAVVDYRIGSKKCRFTTTYSKGFASGIRVPKWNKSAVAEGGARCDVKITSVDYGSHNWSVEFTMH